MKRLIIRMLTELDKEDEKKLVKFINKNVTEKFMTEVMNDE